MISVNCQHGSRPGFPLVVLQPEELCRQVSLNPLGEHFLNKCTQSEPLERSKAALKRAREQTNQVLANPRIAGYQHTNPLIWLPMPVSGMFDVRY